MKTLNKLLPWKDVIFRFFVYPLVKAKMRVALGDVLKRVLMVEPKFFSVQYSINPWMGGKVDSLKAQNQWSQLRLAIEKLGVQVLTMKQAPSLPDMVFTCNSGLVYRDGVYLSKFRHKERMGEQSHYFKWFKENGYTLYGTDYSTTFEGGGDAVFSNTETLWAGWGHRTNKEAYKFVSKLGDFEIVLCELIDPRFYHLDTCFAPVGVKSALWYPPAFSQDSQAKIKKRLPDAIEVSLDEAIAFVCNSITVRNSVISPKGVSERTKDALNRMGYLSVEIDMSEFMKAGGACQCLVMKL